MNGKSNLGKKIRHLKLCENIDSSFGVVACSTHLLISAHLMSTAYLLTLQRWVDG